MLEWRTDAWENMVSAPLAGVTTPTFNAMELRSDNATTGA
jgi:hypothetical protein